MRHAHIRVRRGRAFAILVAGCCMAPATASAQDYRQAYVYALRCLAATSAARDAPGSKRAFDAAMRLGRLLGYDNRRLNYDFENNVEIVKMARSDAYLRQTLRDCAKLGLAS